MAYLELRELRRAFGGVVALDGLSLELVRGETVALVGPNGSGKTTALRLISGSEPPDAGRVLLGGRELTGVRTPDRVELGIARTLQATSSFPDLTALESVLVGRSVRRRFGGAIRTGLATPTARKEAAASEEAAFGALSLVGLAELAHVPTPELTSSQRRLVALAAAVNTAFRRSSFRFFRRNASGSMPIACARSSMCISRAKWFAVAARPRYEPCRSGDSAGWNPIRWCGISYSVRMAEAPEL